MLFSIGEELLEFLQRDIYLLDLPKVVKKARKTLKTVISFAQSKTMARTKLVAMNSKPPLTKTNSYWC